MDRRRAEQLREIRAAQLARAKADDRRAATNRAALDKRHAEELATWTRYFDNCSESERQFWVDRKRKPKACTLALINRGLSLPTDR